MKFNDDPPHVSKRCCVYTHSYANARYCMSRLDFGLKIIPITFFSSSLVDKICWLNIGKSACFNNPLNSWALFSKKRR